MTENITLSKEAFDNMMKSITELTTQVRELSAKQAQAQAQAPSKRPVYHTDADTKDIQDNMELRQTLGDKLDEASAYAIADFFRRNPNVPRPRT